MPDLNVRLHIGATSNDSRVFNADTGEEIRNVRAISFHLDANGETPIPRLTIELCPVALLVDGDAIGARSTLNEERARELLNSFGYDLILKTQVDAERAARA